MWNGRNLGSRAADVGGMRHENVRGADIAERLLDFGANVVRIGNRLPRGLLTRHVALQMVRSATSAGANYEEARHAESRADFVHKVGVAVKELSETSIGYA